MAALQLRPTFLHRLRQLWGRSTAPIIERVAQTAALPVETAVRPLLQPLGLADLLPPLLLAVPKQRTSHSKKRKRMLTKHLRPSQAAVPCRMCGAWTRPHFYCKPNCVGRRNRDDGPGGGDMALAT